MLSGVLHALLASSLPAPPRLSSRTVAAEEPSGPVTHSPARSCRAGFRSSLGLAGFVSHSAICHVVSQQMSVEGQALFWALEMRKGMGPSSCPQAEYPHGMGWGGVQASLVQGRQRTLWAPGPALLFAEIQLHCRHSEVALRWAVPRRLLPPLPPPPGCVAAAGGAPY